MRFSRQPLSLAIALAGALSASASTTLAQGLEEVVVTANKRATSLQDVPLAVSVVDAQIVHPGAALCRELLQETLFDTAETRGGSFFAWRQGTTPVFTTALD